MILDSALLGSIRRQFAAHQGAFNGFAIAVEDIQQQHIRWTAEDTYIQRAALVEDRGVFDSPDEFYQPTCEAGEELAGECFTTNERTLG